MGVDLLLLLRRFEAEETLDTGARAVRTRQQRTRERNARKMARRRTAGHLSRLALALLAAISSLVPLLGCEAHRGPRVLKLAHGLDTSHPVHRAMQHMADRVSETSGGRLRIDLYPSEQLGSERECVELLQIGSLAMTKVSASVMEAFAPSFQVFGLPYLFRNRTHLFAVLEGDIGQELLLEARRFRLRGLCYYDAGSRSFYTRERPVRSPADLAGLKIRTQESTTAMRMVQALGGSATPIAWGELYTALQQGVVDGAENNPPSFYLSHHYEVCRYYSLDEHTAVPDVLLIGTAAWDDLDGEEQRILLAAARESAEVQKELWRRATEEALEAVAAAGVEILHPEHAPFADKVEALLATYGDDPLLGEIIRRIRAVQIDEVAGADSDNSASASGTGGEEGSP